MRRSLFKYQKITNLIILETIKINKRLTIAVWSYYDKERKEKKGYVNRSVIEIRFNW